MATRQTSPSLSGRALSRHGQFPSPGQDPNLRQPARSGIPHDARLVRAYHLLPRKALQAIRARASCQWSNAHGRLDRDSANRPAPVAITTSIAANNSMVRQVERPITNRPAPPQGRALWDWPNLTDRDHRLRPPRHHRPVCRGGRGPSARPSAYAATRELCASSAPSTGRARTELEPHIMLGRYASPPSSRDSLSTPVPPELHPELLVVAEPGRTGSANQPTATTSACPAQSHRPESRCDRLDRGTNAASSRLPGRG